MVDKNIAFLARIPGPMSQEQHTDKICLIQFSYYNTPLAVVLYTLINDHFNSNTNTSSLLTPFISKCVKQCTEYKQSKIASQFESCKSVTYTQNVQEQQKFIGVMAKFPLKVVSA